MICVCVCDKKRGKGGTIPARPCFYYFGGSLLFLVEVGSVCIDCDHESSMGSSDLLSACAAVGLVRTCMLNVNGL